MEYGVYHGCLNSFVITDDVKESDDLSAKAIYYCEKHNADGFIVPKRNPLEMVFYNRDGSRAPMCGNGIRCMILFCFEKGYIKEEQLAIKTLGGLMHAKITSVNPFMVQVNLGKPSYDPKKLDLDSEKEFFNKDFKVNDKQIKLSAIYLGTHHAVVVVNDISESEDMGKIISNHPFFKKKINVNFVKIIDRKNIFIRTYERGVGWTLACGTGASSSFAVLNKLQLVDDEVNGIFQDGKVVLSLSRNQEIIMEGPAERKTYINET